MSAYHSSLWTRFYDAWVDTIFDPNESSEDVNVFMDQLAKVEDLFQDSVKDSDAHKTLVILEVGTGTGRLIRELYGRLSSSRLLSDRTSHCGRSHKYSLIGTEPSESMLKKATDLWHNFQQTQYRFHAVQHEFVKVQWEIASSSDFADRLIMGLHETDWSHSHDEAEDTSTHIPASSSHPVFDLICFAAGGVSHVASVQEVRDFIVQISLSLNPRGGRAVISVLHEFFQRASDVNSQSGSPEQATREHVDKANETAQRVLDPDSNEKLFVKYPTKEQWDGAHVVRTDSFTLALEDRNGEEESREELNWQMRIVNLDEWRQLLAEAGLQVTDIVPGQIQSWVVIQNSCQR